jgi:hypothetical protein
VRWFRVGEVPRGFGVSTKCKYRRVLCKNEEQRPGVSACANSDWRSRVVVTVAGEKKSRVPSLRAVYKRLVTQSLPGSEHPLPESDQVRIPAALGLRSRGLPNGGSFSPGPSLRGGWPTPKGARATPGGRPQRLQPQMALPTAPGSRRICDAGL